jgi:hypothetical protein
MTKLDILIQAKKTKNQAEAADNIRAFYPGYNGMTDSETCYRFGRDALDKDARKAWDKALKL